MYSCKYLGTYSTVHRRPHPTAPHAHSSPRFASVASKKLTMPSSVAIEIACSMPSPSPRPPPEASSSSLSSPPLEPSRLLPRSPDLGTALALLRSSPAAFVPRTPANRGRLVVALPQHTPPSAMSVASSDVRSSPTSPTTVPRQTKKAQRLLLGSLRDRPCLACLDRLLSGQVEGC